MENNNLPVAPLFKALALAQGEFVEVERKKRAVFTTKAGKEVEYFYAELADFIRMVRKPMSKNGLGFTQHLIEVSENFSASKMGVETVIFHSSGAFISSIHPLKIQENPLLSPMQRLGVAETFARRYGLSMALGVASE